MGHAERDRQEPESGVPDGGDELAPVDAPDGKIEQDRAEQDSCGQKPAPTGFGGWLRRVSGLRAWRGRRSISGVLDQLVPLVEVGALLLNDQRREQDESSYAHAVCHATRTTLPDRRTDQRTDTHQASRSYVQSRLATARTAGARAAGSSLQR